MGVMSRGCPFGFMGSSDGCLGCHSVHPRLVDPTIQASSYAGIPPQIQSLRSEGGTTQFSRGDFDQAAPPPPILFACFPRQVSSTHPPSPTNSGSGWCFPASWWMKSSPIYDATNERYGAARSLPDRGHTPARNFFTPASISPRRHTKHGKKSLHRRAQDSSTTFFP